MSEPARHHRPTRPGAAFFEAQLDGPDPADVSAAAERAAIALVRGTGAGAASGEPADADSAIAERVVRLAETEGLETLAELWAGAASDSVAGCLWRLYALRSWVYADPLAAATEFEAGRADAQVADVVAGVADPPDPQALRAMIDDVLRGIVEREFADVLLRAAAFARVVAIGRARLRPDDVLGERMLVVSQQLESAAHLELAGELA